MLVIESSIDTVMDRLFRLLSKPPPTPCRCVLVSKCGESIKVWRELGLVENYQTMLIGVIFLAFLLVTEYIGKKYKKLFWIPAIAPLTSVIIATFCVYITRTDKQGVRIVTHIRQGINPPSLHKIYFTGDNLAKGFKIGVVVGMVALTEAIALGRTFAAMKDYSLDGNKEMVALGSMNIVGSMTSCYVATGSFSRSAVNYMAGCHTAVSNIVMSMVVLLLLEVIAPLFKYTPNAILASIIISAVLGLINIKAMILLWTIDKFDFVACMGAFFGAVFVSVEIGLLIAVSISFAKILLQVTRPQTVFLGKIPRSTLYRNVQQYPDAIQIPGILIVRVDSAIYFLNSNYIKERILRGLIDEDKLKVHQLTKIQYLIVEMPPVTDIDTSVIYSFEELYRAAQKEDVQLILANPGNKEEVQADTESDNEDQQIYNRLKLLMGFDGKPLSYWLYKLHGLGQEFKCEICGTQSYGDVELMSDILKNGAINMGCFASVC